MSSGCISRLRETQFIHKTTKGLSYSADIKIVSGCSKRPSSEAAGESKPEAYPQGYVEDFDELRTKLTDFFSSLLVRFYWGRLRLC